MLINDKVDAVFIPDSPSRIKATDYNQIKNEIQECITEAGLTPTKDVIQLPQALKILTAQSGAEEVAKIEAAGQEQLDAINTAGAQAVQDAQDAANTATAKATEAASSASAAASSASAASGSASTAATQAGNAADSAELAQKWATQTTAEVVSGQGYGAKYYADQAADSASSANASASTATTKATEASDSASAAAQSAQDAANSAASARGLQIGAVFFSQSALATDNPGGLPLWTGEYYSNGSSLYPDFYAWVKRHAELCKTKTEYDSAISTYGECPYYVVDEVAGSLRLPKLVNYLKMANDTDGITQAHAGLPNITGTGLYWEATEDTKNQLTGCFFVDTNKKNNLGSRNTDNDNYSVAMDVSRSSAIYGGSDTVTPAHTTLYPWIYAFNSAVSASEAQAAEFTEALSGKANADLSNGTKATQATINNIMPDAMDYVVESYSDDDGNWYRVYKSGWVEQGGDSGTYTNNQTKTITLLKAFENTNYIVIPINTNVTADNYYTYQPNSLSATNFQIKCQDMAGSSGGSVKWIAYGQGAN